MSDKKRRVMSDEELVELIRYAVLSHDDFDLSDEFSAAMYSTWCLMNPLSLAGRDNVGTVTPFNSALPKEKTDGAIRFTAHAHTEEPQTPSPDDLIIYSSMNSENDDTVHFITDRFSCKKIL